ncbi:MAG: hypothetical protein Q8O86_01005, partial [Dehalococcoidia bacterium]|nr:hypothetical protein [Dehalococcoidia bacterium]
MRTLSAALTAAQKSASAAPYVRVRAIRKIGGVGRLDWERLYTGAEAEVSHGATQPADGSLLRIRVNAGQVQIQRTTSPGPASNFATWPAGTGSDVSCVAICSSGASVWAFYANFTDRKVYASASTDSGATWGAWTAITAAGGAISSFIAAAMKSNGDVLVIYDQGATLYKVKRSGGAWGAQAAWTNSAASITGLAIYYANDFNIIVTGTEVTTTHPRVWSCIYGDGYSQGADTWSALAEITGASAGSGVAYKLPSLAQPDVYRAFWVETYS